MQNKRITAGRLNGKVALVTGGTNGIGKEIVRCFSTEGALVFFCGRDAEAGQSVVDEMAMEGMTVSFSQCDVTNVNAIKYWVKRTTEKTGRIDIVVANAGGARLKPWPSEETDVFDSIIQLNLNGVLYVCRAAWPELVESGSGAIVIIGSLSAWMAVGHDQHERMDHVQPSPSYQASKAAVEGLAVHLAGRGGEHNIRVNVIRPGRILTERYEKLLGSDGLWWPHYKKIQLLKRHGRSEDVANAAVFLASEESSFITGTMLDVNGGAVAKL
jgi:NAD(P)-dependent dehydrogenase (short-subunit alcohol dehydrogenase family)